MDFNFLEQKILSSRCLRSSVPMDQEEFLFTIEKMLYDSDESASNIYGAIAYILYFSKSSKLDYNLNAYTEVFKVMSKHSIIRYIVELLMDHEESFNNVIEALLSFASINKDEKLIEKLILLWV